RGAGFAAMLAAAALTGRGLLAVFVAAFEARFCGLTGRTGLSSRERKPCRVPDRPLPPRAPLFPEPLCVMGLR
ncbi:hypothetical protein, partial [Microvirga brassicacearum]|uniref:hypothetical protein n=1 Tax=Microvirga brassicacearum TaxID=2580413 RepID=UPI001AEEE5CD